MRCDHFAIAAAVTAMTLAGCGSASHMSGAAAPVSSSTGNGDSRNAADIAFVQEMVPMQQQASDILKLAEMHGAGREVTNLVSHMQGAQATTLMGLQECLGRWGMKAMMSGGSGAQKNLPGMMSADDIMELRGTSGRGFDRSFLTMMKAHYQGAIGLARTELAHGRYGPAKAIATTLVRVDSADVANMIKLLGT